MADATPILAYWIGLVAVATLWGVAQGLVLRDQMRRTQFSRAPHQVTPLMGASYACWVGLAGLVRIFLAFNIDNRPLFDLTIATFVIVLVFYSFETWVAKTAHFRSVIAPFIISTVSLAWLLIHRVTYF